MKRQQKNYKKNHLKKIQLDEQIYDAIESRANFWNYYGIQQNPNLSTGTYGCSHVFEYGASIGISWVKMGLNIKFQF